MEAFHKIGDFVKRHPYGTAVAVFAIGVIYVYQRKNNSVQVSGGTIDPNSNEIAAGTQLQQTQLAYQAQSNQVQAQANVASQEIAGQVTVAGLQAQTQQNNNNQQAAVATINSNNTATTDQLIATLQASVANASTAASVQSQQIQATAYTNIAAINAAAQTTIASAPYLSADYIAQLQSEDYLASLPTNAQITALQTQLAGLTTTVNNVSANQATTNTALITTIADLDNWSQRYEGGTIAPVNNTSLFPSGYNNTVILPH